MKVVILAGGFGTRISEESHLKPKPMVPLGERPVLWHIMKIYSHYGFHDFVICLGYKGEVIKEYFAHYYLYSSDLTFDFSCSNHQTIHSHCAEPWKVTLVDTGLHTMTGGRIRRVRQYLENEPFLLTYGDGLSDVPIDRLVEYHKNHGGLVTLTAVQPLGRFGQLGFSEGDRVTSFQEKPQGDGGWVNGGFFVMEPEFLDYLEGDDTVLERGPLERVAREERLMAYRHRGFWQPMDTMRDRNYLESLWEKGDAPWRVWNDNE
jgi:glucose-1-phosphate cytidylyltransferase